MHECRKRMGKRDINPANTGAGSLQYHRDILVLKFVGGFTLKEIGEILDLPFNGVKSAYFRAVQRVRLNYLMDLFDAPECDEFRSMCWLEDEIPEENNYKLWMHLCKCKNCRREYNVKKRIKRNINKYKFL